MQGRIFTLPLPTVSLKNGKLDVNAGDNAGGLGHTFFSREALFPVPLLSPRLPGFFKVSLGLSMVRINAQRRFIVGNGAVVVALVDATAVSDTFFSPLDTILLIIILDTDIIAFFVEIILINIFFIGQIYRWIFTELKRMRLSADNHFPIV